MNYEKAIHAIIDPLVEEPDLIFIKTNESDDGKELSVIIATAKDDVARLIGRHGNIANAIREVISVAGKVENKRVHIKFESFVEEKED